MQKFLLLWSILLCVGCRDSVTVRTQVSNETEKTVIETTDIRLSLPEKELTTAEQVFLTGLQTQQLLLQTYREDVALQEVRAKEDRRLWQTITVVAMMCITALTGFVYAIRLRYLGKL